MKKTLALCCLCLVLVGISCNSTNIDNKNIESKKDLSRGTLKEWVIPKENNWKLLKEGLEGMSISKRISFFKLPNDKLGILEGEFMKDNLASSNIELFDIQDEEIKLLKRKLPGGLIVSDSVHTYQSDNIYWKLPTSSDTSHWVFLEPNDHIDSCSCYWSTYNIKNETRDVLIVERNSFNNNSGKLFGKTLEVYQKNKGIYAIEHYSGESGKLLMRYVVSEVGFDKSQDNSKFPLSSTVENDNVGIKNISDSDGISKPTESALQKFSSNTKLRKFSCAIVSYMRYQQPLKVGNKYSAYYTNMGDLQGETRIHLDEENQTFSYKWFNGESWEAHYTSRKTEYTNIQYLGEVIRTTYTGQWIDGQKACELIVDQSRSNKSLFSITLKSIKIIDDEYGINAWKYIYHAYTHSYS